MFEFRSPGLVRFGAGVFEELGIQTKALGVNRVLLVCDPGICELGYSDQAGRHLEQAGVEVVLFNDVDPEPLDSNVEAGLAAYVSGGCGALVAIGGGSSIDVAKAVAAMARNEGKIADYAVGGRLVFEHPKAPLIAISTTAGTGSEVSRFTIITDTGRDVKLLINHPFLIPEIALVDPALTMSMSPHLTMATGIDALTHALEAYLSVKATPLSDVFALEAVRLISGNLRQAWADGTNVTARENMMLGSLIAGLAFGNASVALVHGMARPLGANFHVPHGLSNAVLLAACMEFTLIGAPARFAALAQAMGEQIAGLSTMEAAERAVDLIGDLCMDLEVPALSELGIEQRRLEELAPKMAQDALASGSPGNNPRKATEEQIVALYFTCY